jgi:hypothetical protein
MGTLLATYLNDHLAGATAGRELARRAAANNRKTELGFALEELAREIDHDRDALIELMRSLDVSRDRLKVLGGWTLEKVGRLKLNGRLLGYSPLSRLLELEGLTLGVRGKLGLWLALQALKTDHTTLGLADLSGLAARAEEQLSRLEPLRLQAARETLLP